jgi:peroxiredoxin
VADSSIVDANGKLTLARKSPLPAGFYTFLLPGNKYLSFLVDLDQRFTVTAKAADIPGTAVASGDLNPRLFFENQRFQASIEPELTKLSETMQKNNPESSEYKAAKARQSELIAARKKNIDDIITKHPNAFFSKFKIAGQNPELRDFRKPNGDLDTIKQVVDYRNHFWDAVDFCDARLLHTPVIINKLKRHFKELSPQRPDSLILIADQFIQKSIKNKEYFKFFVNWIALNFENGKTTIMDGEAVFVHVVKKYFTPELAFWDTKESLNKIQKHVGEMEASLLGKKGPDVIAPDVNGELRSIYEKKAPLIVVFMFSPDCEHCQKEAPEVQALYEKWKDKGVDFYGIAIKTTDLEWKDFIQKNKFTFTNVFDPTNRAIYAKYYVDITPEIYLLNSDRTIIAKNLHPNQLEAFFEKELKKLNRK